MCRTTLENQNHFKQHPVLLALLQKKGLCMKRLVRIESFCSNSIRPICAPKSLLLICEQERSVHRRDLLRAASVQIASPVNTALYGASPPQTGRVMQATIARLGLRSVLENVILESQWDALYLSKYFCFFAGNAARVSPPFEARMF